MQRALGRTHIEETAHGRQIEEPLEDSTVARSPPVPPAASGPTNSGCGPASPSTDYPHR
jgi:hypothetical protein